MSRSIVEMVERINGGWSETSRLVDFGSIARVLEIRVNPFDNVTLIIGQTLSWFKTALVFGQGCSNFSTGESGPQ